MYTKALRKLADALESSHAPFEFNDPRACIAGWAIKNAGLPYPGNVEVFPDAREILGLTDKQADALFFDRTYGRSRLRFVSKTDTNQWRPYVTRAMAVAALRRMADL